MSLTAKREAFAQTLAGGATQADAYRAHYSTANSTPKTIQEAASRLAADSKVSARLDELKAELASQELWTRKESVDVLKSIAENATSPEAARVSSIKELNSMHGFNEPAKVDLNHKGLSKIVLEAVDGDSEG